MTPNEINGYKRLAVDLETHVRFFQSSPCDSHAKKTPQFSAGDAQMLMAGYRQGRLDITVENLAQSKPYCNLNDGQIKQLIHEFFNKELYKKSLGSGCIDASSKKNPYDLFR